MADDKESSQNAAYVEWKGWVTDLPFGYLPRGEVVYFERELRGVTAKSTPVRDVLEVGFGNGTFLEYCRLRGWAVTGTELQPELVAAAKDAGFDAYLAEELDKIPDAAFDLIVAFDVLEHIPQADIVDLLSTLSAKLRRNGVMVFRFPNADSWLGNPLQFGDPTHVTAIGYLKMTNFALRAKLEIVAFRATTRHGFATSFAHGIYSVLAGPVISAAAFVKRMLYFPDIPVVLSTSNVVCVVRLSE